MCIDGRTYSSFNQDDHYHLLVPLIKLDLSGGMIGKSQPGADDLLPPKVEDTHNELLKGRTLFINYLENLAFLRCTNKANRIMQINNGV